MTVSEADLKKIVQDGDPHLLVAKAKALGQNLSGQATTTQIRRLFSTYRQIEMSWPYAWQEQEESAQRDKAYRELVLFGPRLEYQTQKHAGLRQLADAIKMGIKYVDKNDRKTLQHLGEFFEAIVAYAIVKTEEQNRQGRKPRSQQRRQARR